MTLTKKYRLIWEWYNLNIQNDHERDYSGTATIIIDNNKGLYESDVYQDILDKINELGLHPIGEWVDYEDI